LAEVIDEPKFRYRMYVFDDRFHAGELLADKLSGYRGKDAIILAIPAGGVPVGFVLARKLGLPLDVLVVRKLHIPWNPEAGFGALTWDGIVIFNEPLLGALGLTEEEVRQCVEEENEAVRRRVALFRGDRPFPDLSGKVAILVDDGLASGFSMLAGLRAVRRRNPSEVVVAIPTASADAIALIRPLADKIFCLNIRKGFLFAVADAYRRWYDVSDKEVMAILKALAAGER